MKTQEEIYSIYDLVDTTIKDLYDMTVRINSEKNIICVDCYLFGKRKIIKLPITEIKLYTGSVKSFLTYLKEKMTEELKEMYNE